MNRFDNDTQVERIDERRWRAEVSPAWSIGVNPNGGYVLAVVLAAARDAIEHPHPLTTTAHFLKPATTGPAEVHVEVHKVGRRQSTVSGWLVQDGVERLRVLSSFGDLDTFAGPSRVTATPPDLPPVEECEQRSEAVLATLPEIARRVDLRLRPGVMFGPPADEHEAVFEGWVRFSDEREPDVASLPFLADAFPPPALRVVTASWIPTLELTVHVRAVPAPGWMRARFATRVMVDGLLEEDGELWDSAGRLVAQSRQLALVLPG